MLRMMKWSTLLVVAVTSLACGVFVTTAYHAVVYAPSDEVASSTLERRAPSDKVTASELPDRLNIPALDLDTWVLPVGVAISGNMAVPPNYIDAGWYKYGTVPGQKGSAVIAGHVDNGLALDGVFKQLNKLKLDDDIYIITKEGTRLHFVVVGIESYPYTEVPTDLLFNRADTARLNLITCDGGWIQGKKTYDRRLVIYTKLV